VDRQQEGSVILDTGSSARPAVSRAEATSGAMSSRIIRVRDLSRDDELAWRDLATRAAEPNPFYEPDCLIPAAKHQTFGGDINLVVAEMNGRFYGCLPFRAVNRWKFPYPVLTSQVRRMNGLGTPLIDPALGVATTAELLKALAGQRSLFHGRIFVLDTSGAGGPVARYLRQAAEQLGYTLCAYETFDRGRLIKSDSPNYEMTVSYKSRRNLRRQMRQLSEAVGSQVEQVDRSDDPSAIDDYIALEALGYKAQKGIAMTTVPGEPEYFREMCARFAAAGRLQLLALQAGSQTIAMQMWIRAGEGSFLIKGSYDETYARFGPGVLLHTYSIDFFNKRADSEWMDSCTGKDHKLLFRLWKNQREIEMLAIVLGSSLIDRAVIKAFMSARPLHRRYYDLTRPNHALPGNEGASKVAGSHSSHLDPAAGDAPSNEASETETEARTA
jgi:CelD/BcsL family acetyltransferase involved in cellulose biosynthesis